MYVHVHVAVAGWDQCIATEFVCKCGSTWQRKRRGSECVACMYRMETSHLGSPFYKSTVLTRDQTCVDAV